MANEIERPEIKGVITYNAQGDAVSFVGEDATEVYRLAVLRSALEFNIKTGMKISRVYRFSTVKQTTGLKTNDKAAHSARLLEMIAEQKTKCAHVFPEGEER
jgi:hypothetical protein